MTQFSLFSGICGLDLAAEWAGFTTVGQCEFADYPTKVLEKYWQDVLDRKLHEIFPDEYGFAPFPERYPFIKEVRY